MKNYINPSPAARVAAHMYNLFISQDSVTILCGPRIFIYLLLFFFQNVPMNSTYNEVIKLKRLLRTFFRLNLGISICI